MPCPIHDEFVAVRKQIKDMMRSAIPGDYHHALEIKEKYLTR
jgi:hypothetical protein